MKERINIKRVSKKFKIGYIKKNSALFNFLSLISGKENKKEISVLKDISLSLNSGETLGIIGRNGSGKSTLLRIIAGIYEQDEGIIKTEGKMIYLTGFGNGMNPKLTMKENIFLVGSIMGLSQKEITGKMNEIVEFSGLKDFLNTKVYQFSSGMINRLNTSITLHCIAHTNPDILLLDEVFAGGADMDFQEKGLKKMEELLKKGAAVIFVSHDLERVKQYCDKAIWLENGEIQKEGIPEEVITNYKKSSNLKK